MVHEHLAVADNDSSSNWSHTSSTLIEGTVDHGGDQVNNNRLHILRSHAMHMYTFAANINRSI